MRVLLVEDDLPVAETLRDFLAEQGHEVLIATDGIEGLRALLEEHPDAAFVDVVLPKLNGLAILERLKHLGQPLPLVAMSGHASEAEARSCLKLGALDYLPKPFTLEQVELVLQVLEVAKFQRRRESPSLSS